MITKTHEIITPQLAQDYLRFNKANRPLNKQVVKTIVDDISRGGWIYDGNPIRFSEDGWLIDGQHRLHACVVSGKDIETDVIRGLPRESFKVIDTGRARSGGDILSIMGVSNATIISSSIFTYLSLATSKKINVAEKSTGHYNVHFSKEKVADFYLDNQNLCDEIGRIAYSFGRGKTGIKILSSGFIGGYMLYFIFALNHPKERVIDFFTQLQTGRDITNKTILIFREAIIKHKLGQSVLSTEQRNVYFKKTWNAFVTGKELNRLTYNAERKDSVDFL